jgi:hypothetical protein
MIKIGLDLAVSQGLAASPRSRPKLGLQEQVQTNTEAARPILKQNHHCKTFVVLQIFFPPKTH